MNKRDFKILIVNDEKIVAYSFFLVLARNGFSNIYFAKTYEEALYIAKKERPFLIIQDILFGPLTGTNNIIESDFCHYLKKKYRINHFYISGIYKSNIKKTNPIAFITLPPRDEELLKAVERGLYEYSNRIRRKPYPKYKMNQNSIRSIRKIEMENRINENKIKIIKSKVNGHSLYVVE